MPTKILIITERFYPEEFLINDLALYWAEKGFRVGVLTQSPSYPAGKIYEGYRFFLFRKDSWHGIAIHRFRTVEGYAQSLFCKLLNYFNFVFLGSVRMLALGRRYDKIFIYQTGPLTLALPAVLARFVFGKKAVIWVQDIWPDSVYGYGFKKTFFLSAFLNMLVKIVYGACEKIFVSCEGFAQKIKPYCGAKKVPYFPNWPMADCGGAGVAPAKLSDKFNFTFAGNIGKMQNLENVILGFEIFIKSGGQATLNLVGGGSNLDNLRQLVSGRKIDNVVFWGRKPPSEMSGFFAASQALIISLKDLPIYELTVPSKFQVYLTAKKPIFCVMKGEVKNMVDKYELGLCADPSDPKDIAAGFTKLSAATAEQSQNYSQNSAELLITRYSKEKIIRALTAEFLA